MKREQLGVIAYMLSMLLVFSVGIYIMNRNPSAEKKRVAQLEKQIAEDELVLQYYQNTTKRTLKLLEGKHDEIERLTFQLQRERQARVSERASRSRRLSDLAVRGDDSTVSREFRRATQPASGPLRHITGYCATGNRTASGKVPRPGMVATISRSIPFGTRIHISGIGTFTVEDRIGHSSEFDIFFASCSEARQFGRKYLRVEIL